MDSLLVAGLGNPGREYEGTRHNLGFMFADDLASFCRLRQEHRLRHSVVAEGQWKNNQLIVAKPTTYMNRSGLAVVELLRHFDLPMENLLVASDDVNLPLGQTRLRPRGSAGGQKGLQSIIEQTGTTEFARLRMGMGPAPENVPLEDFVLQDFFADELPEVEDMIWRCRDGIICLLQQGFDQAMNRMNQRLNGRCEEDKKI